MMMCLLWLLDFTPDLSIRKKEAFWIKVLGGIVAHNVPVVYYLLDDIVRPFGFKNKMSLMIWEKPYCQNIK